MAELVSRAVVEETLQWIEDWRGGDFTPAYYRQGGALWPVEMEGLAGSYEKLAEGYLQALTAIEAVSRALRLACPSPDATPTEPECESYSACGRGCCG